jgi:TetR/AcrR family transcriptional regulator, regulator of cefoperazone and chloramphenicol sensitivity
MKAPRQPAIQTRKRLLDAAGEVFAERGYREATIAEICCRARVNIAAVNYHFRNKENLYVEAWRRLFLKSLEEHPPDGGVRPDAPAEERLHGHILALIKRIADLRNKEFHFVQREFASPTGLLEEVMKREVVPLRQRTEALVRELLGPDASNRDIQFCEMSIINQCINPMVIGRPGQRASNIRHPLIRELELFADHVVQFSIAGIRARRRSTESTQAAYSRKKPNDKLTTL